MANVLRITEKENGRIETVAFDRENVSINMRTETIKSFANITININSIDGKNIKYVSVTDSEDIVTKVENDVENLSIPKFMDEMTNDDIFNMMMSAKHIIINIEENTQFIEIF